MPLCVEAQIPVASPDSVFSRRAEASAVLRIGHLGRLLEVLAWGEEKGRAEVLLLEEGRL